MTTTAPTSAPSLSRLHLLAIAVGASVVHLLLLLPGYSEDGSLELGSWLAGLGVSLVVSLVVFLLVVPGRGVTTGIVLGAVAVVSVLVFWAGVTLPLAAAAAVLGWRAHAGHERTRALVALGLAALSVVALIAIIYSDAMNT
jgi:hypothetical protein